MHIHLAYHENGMVALLYQSLRIVPREKSQLMRSRRLKKHTVKGKSVSRVRTVIGNDMSARFVYRSLQLHKKRLRRLVADKMDDFAALYPLPAVEGKIDENISVFF